MDRVTETAIPTVLPRRSPGLVGRDYVKDGVEMCGRCSWAKVVCRCDKDAHPLALQFIADLDDEIRETQEWDAEMRRYDDGLVRLDHTVVATCRRGGCNLPAEYNGLCEPCHESGDDEPTYEEGLRHEDKNDWGGR
jgi:hypothetical protein